MQTSDIVLAELTRILNDNTSLRQPVSLDLALISERALDSMDFMNYITVVEERYNVIISDRDISERRLGVIRNMVEFLVQRTSPGESLRG